MSSDGSVTGPAPEAQAPAFAPPRSLIVAAVLVLGGFIAAQGRVLWHEFGALRGEQGNVERSAVIGFPNVHPMPSFAQPPDDWFHDEDDVTLLWAGWKPGIGHRWFRVGRGDVERARVSWPSGRDVIRVIDEPLVEHLGGAIWGRLPDDSLVAGQVLSGTQTVYPILVLRKVGIVNDQVGGRPYLITYNPFAIHDDLVRIYEPLIEGKRVTMGWSGYFHDREPMLYDRDTESLWVEEDGTLRALAGPHKGVRLKGIGHPEPQSWGDWRREYPGSRLLVGATRAESVPTTR